MTTLHPVATNSGPTITTTTTTTSAIQSISNSQYSSSDVGSGGSDTRLTEGESDASHPKTSSPKSNLDKISDHSQVQVQVQVQEHEKEGGHQGEVVVVESRRLSALSQHTNNGRHSVTLETLGKDTATAKTTDTQLSSSASIIDFVDSTIVIHPRDSSQGTLLLRGYNSTNSTNFQEEEEEEEREEGHHQDEAEAEAKGNEKKEAQVLQQTQPKQQKQIETKKQSQDQEIAQEKPLAQDMLEKEKEKMLVDPGDGDGDGDGGDVVPKKEQTKTTGLSPPPAIWGEMTKKVSSTATATTATANTTATTTATTTTETTPTTPTTTTNAATRKPAMGSAVRMMNHPPRSPRRGGPPSAAMKRRFEGLQRVARFQETSMHSIPPPEPGLGGETPENHSNHTEISYYTADSICDEDDTTAGRSSAMASGGDSSGDYCGSSSAEDPDATNRTYRERLERATSRHSMYSLSSAFTLCDLGSISDVSSLGFDDVDYEINDISADDSSRNARENHEVSEIFLNRTPRRGSLLALQSSIGEMTIEVGPEEEEETTEGDDMDNIIGDEDDEEIDDDDDSSEPPRFLSRERMYKSFMVDDSRNIEGGDGGVERPSFRPSNSTRYLFENDENDETDELDLAAAKHFLTAMAAEEQQRQFHFQSAEPHNENLIDGTTATTTLTAMGHSRSRPRGVGGVQSDYTEVLVTSDDDDVPVVAPPSAEMTKNPEMSGHPPRQSRAAVRQYAASTRSRESILSLDYTEVEVEDEFEEEVLSDYEEEEVIEEVVVDDD